VIGASPDLAFNERSYGLCLLRFTKPPSLNSTTSRTS
jgi:hypothetical protein